MAAKGKRPMRALTPGDKIEAIQRVNDGESKASVARDIGVPESTLRGWCKNEDKLRYMTSRLSSPSGDTDKSNDGDPPEKRARTESPPTPKSSDTSGLDLTNTTSITHTPSQVTPVIDAPVELTTKRSEPSPPVHSMHSQRERRPEPGASVSMSAISPLSGFAHLPGLAHSNLGLSFNEVAHNLSLLAQLNPSLSALSSQPASRALRSIRSPKPSHNGLHNLNDNKHHHRNKSSHTSSSDLYRPSSSKGNHIGNPASATQPADDSMWLWLHHAQKAMLDLTARTSTTLPLQLGKHAEATLPPKPVAPISPMNNHLDYNTFPWFSYYRQIGGARPLPDDKLKSAQVPKEKSAENILYSHLTKGKTEEDVVRHTTTSPNQIPPQNKAQQMKILDTVNGNPPTSELTRSPELGSENKEPNERPTDVGRNQTKVRNVLDDILFINNQIANEEAKTNVAATGQCETGTAEALEHGEKFLAWCESSSDPSVTRVHVHQLRALLNNLRTRRSPTIPSAEAIRRK